MADEQTEIKSEDVVVRTQRWFWPLLILITAIFTLPISYLSYAYVVSPDAIRHPRLEHFHFRMQVIIDGHAEDFSSAKYQATYATGQCTVDLPSEPVRRDQFVHIHWRNMTGGAVLKYYGWNLIGGPDSIIGYRFDEFPRLTAVPIHAKALPAMPADTTMYIYTGDEQGYQQRSVHDFTYQSLEKFFATKSLFPHDDTSSSLLQRLFPTAYAHEVTTAAAGTSQEDLDRINNLLGNVVIFVQKDKPTAEQVKARFDHLVPLTDSTCGG